MKIETVLKRRDRAISRLCDLYSTATICGMTSAAMNERVAAIKAETLKGCPAWPGQYFNGFRAALDRQLYRDSLMFGGYVDGRFYSTHSNRADYYEKHGIAPSEFADNGKVSGRGHYWKTTAEPKPFFVS